MAKFIENVFWFVTMGLDDAKARMTQALLQVENPKNQNQSNSNLTPESIPNPPSAIEAKFVQSNPIWMNYFEEDNDNFQKI